MPAALQFPMTSCSVKVWPQPARRDGCGAIDSRSVPAPFHWKPPFSPRDLRLVPPTVMTRASCDEMPANETERLRHAYDSARLAHALWHGTTDPELDKFLTSMHFNSALSSAISMVLSPSDVEWFATVCQRQEVVFCQTELPGIICAAEATAAMWALESLTMSPTKEGLSHSPPENLPRTAWMDIVCCRPWTPAHDLGLAGRRVQLLPPCEAGTHQRFLRALHLEAGATEGGALLAFLRSKEGTQYLNTLHRLTDIGWGLVKCRLAP